MPNAHAPHYRDIFGVPTDVTWYMNNNGEGLFDQILYGTPPEYITCETHNRSFSVREMLLISNNPASVWPASLADAVCLPGYTIPAYVCPCRLVGMLPGNAVYLDAERKRRCKCRGCKRTFS